MDQYKFLIAGVGGQGTILASDVLAEVGIRLGFDSKKSDILGLAVRGGAVVSHIQWAPRVHAPVLEEGDVDILIGFEWLETFRRLDYLRVQGTVLANDYRIDPMTVTSGAAQYPQREQIEAALKSVTSDIFTIPGTQTALDLGEVRTFNMVVMGGLSKILKSDPEVWRSVIADRVPPKVVELNQTAFDRGRELLTKV